MANFIDLTNQKYGKLLVLQRDGYDGSKKIMWLCKCDCGQIKRIRGNDLRSGKVISCCNRHRRGDKHGQQCIPSWSLCCDKRNCIHSTAHSIDGLFNHIGQSIQEGKGTD